MAKSDDSEIKVTKKKVSKKKVSKKTAVGKPAVTKKAVTKKKTASKKKVSKKAVVSKTITSEQRYQMVQEAAYHLAEKSGFDSSYDLDNWLAAEAQIKAKLAKEKISVA